VKQKSELNQVLSSQKQNFTLQVENKDQWVGILIGKLSGKKKKKRAEI